MTCYNSELPIGPPGPVGPQGPPGEPATLPFSRSLFAGTLNANSANIASQINNLGGTISITYLTDWNFKIERTGGDVLTGVALINFNNGTKDSTTENVVFLTYGSTYLSFEDGVTVKLADNTSPDSDGLVNYSFTIDYFPNGFNL